MEEEKDLMAELQDNEPVEPPPPPPAPVPVVVSVKKEEFERVVDDTDQQELAKSMTKFFETLTEEAKGDNKEV